MKNVGELLAGLGGIGGLIAGLISWFKYVRNPVKTLRAGKADQEDMDDIERRLKAVENDMAALQQTLHGGDSEVDDGILVELQEMANENEQQLKAIRRELREIAHQIEANGDGETGDIKYRGGQENE